MGGRGCQVSLTLGQVRCGDELSGNGILESACSLFRPGEEYPSEILLGGVIKKKEETNIVNTKISERTEGADKVPLFRNLFIVGGGKIICGGSVEGGARFCMLLVYKQNTVLHTRSRGPGDYLPRGNKQACVVMDPSSPRSPSSALFKLVLSENKMSNVKCVERLLLLPYTLGLWEEIFQILETEAHYYQ